MQKGPFKLSWLVYINFFQVFLFAYSLKQKAFASKRVKWRIPLELFQLNNALVSICLPRLPREMPPLFFVLHTAVNRSAPGYSALNRSPNSVDSAAFPHTDPQWPGNDYLLTHWVALYRISKAGLSLVTLVFNWGTSPDTLHMLFSFCLLCNSHRSLIGLSSVSYWPFIGFSLTGLECSSFSSKIFTNFSGRLYSQLVWLD